MRRRKLFGSAITLAATLSLAGCGGMPTEQPMFDPRQMTFSQRQAATEDQQEPIRPLPISQENPLGGPGNEDLGTTRPVSTNPAATTGPAIGYDNEPVMHISLQQAVQRAVVFNPDVKVAGYQPAIDAATVVEAEARYDPVLVAQFQYQSKNDENAGTEYTVPTGNPANPFTNVFSRYDVESIATGQIGIKQQLQSGGQIELDYNSSYNDLYPPRYLDNPYYLNNISLQLTQPLLKNFGADVNNARIVINRENARISVLEFRKTLEQQISKVEETYWALANDENTVQTEENLLRINQETYRLQYDRFKQHLNSVLEVSQAQAFLNAREATLIAAKTALRNDSDQLKELMNDPGIPVSSPVVLIPSDSPVDEPLMFDIADQINSAMQNRYELGEQLLKIDQADVTYNVAKNNTLPELDFVGSVSPNAEGRFYGNVLEEQSKFGAWDYSLGLQFQFPIGNRAALSILYRTSEQRLQAIAQYDELVDTIALQVRQAAREVSTDFNLVVVNRNSLFAAQKALYDLIRLQRGGVEPLDATFVQLRLQLSDQVAQADEAQYKALTDYNIALERLELAKGTLLRYNNIILQEAAFHDQGLITKSGW